MNSKAMRHLLLGAFGVFSVGAVLPLACASPEDANIPSEPGVVDASPDREAGSGGTTTEAGTGGSGGYGTGGSGGYGTGGTSGAGGSGGYGTGGYGTGGYGTGGYTGGYGGGGAGGYGGGGAGGGAAGSGGSMAYSGSQVQPSSKCASNQVWIFGDCYP